MAKTFQASAILFLLSAMLVGLVFMPARQWSVPSVLTALTTGICVTIFCCLGVVFLFLSTQHVPEHYTLRRSIIHFVLNAYLVYIGKTKLKQIRRCLRYPRQAQEDRWQEIITTNRDTDYGRMIELKDIRNLNDLKKKLPITSYNDYEPYVQRIAKGEKDVMSTDPVTRLVVTSGTTGKSKWIPLNMNELTPFFGLLKAHQQECFPEVQQMQPVFRLHCNSTLKKSEGGITIGAAMALERETAQRMVMFSTPPDGFMIDTIHEALYIHFLFALRERYLGSTMAIFTSIMVDGFKFLEDNWPEMVNDIANGTINQSLQLPTYIRNSLERAIGSGDIIRAREVRRECEKGQIGIMKRLWPFMEYVTVIDNIQIRKTLMSTIGKGLTFYSPLYSASEGIVGVNFNPFNKGDEEYVMAVWDFIYEFIKEEDIDKPCPETFFTDEVEVGKNYELVITQKCGLYRYRFGDVVKVTGHLENTPKVKFLYRTATLLNLFGEKVDQPVIADALKAALVQTPELQLVHYCVAESTMLFGMPEYNDDETKEAHHVFFLEMETQEAGNSNKPDIDTTKLAELIDENIYTRHSIYRTFKDKNRIHGCKVYLVKRGTFNTMKEFILANTSASLIQYKMPQKVRTKDMAKILLKGAFRSISCT